MNYIVYKTAVSVAMERKINFCFCKCSIQIYSINFCNFAVFRIQERPQASPASVQDWRIARILGR